MDITITIRELMDRDVWLQACEMTGTSTWVVNEGQADPSDLITLTYAQARELGLFRDTPEKPTAIRVSSRNQLQHLAATLGVRPDWHEPDEQDVSAVVRGTNFDNAGFWGREPGGALVLRTYGNDRQEMWVELYQHGEAVAEINLASLLAWATGYEEK
jgi:hypothetical protein